MSTELTPELVSIAEQRMMSMIVQGFNALEIREKIASMHVEARNSEFPSVRGYVQMSLRLDVSAAGIIQITPKATFSADGNTRRETVKLDAVQLDMSAQLKSYSSRKRGSR